jgi:hypothetical protein
MKSANDGVDLALSSAKLTQGRYSYPTGIIKTACNMKRTLKLGIPW